jgi:hypothetical protein
MAALWIAACARVPAPTEPLTPDSILGTYTLTAIDKVMTVDAGTSGIVSGRYDGARGTFTIRKDTFIGSFAIPQEGVADSLAGSCSLAPYPYGAGGYTCTPPDEVVRGFAGFTYQAGTLTVFYRMGNLLPYVTYALTFVRA